MISTISIQNLWHRAPADDGELTRLFEGIRHGSAFIEIGYQTVLCERCDSNRVQEIYLFSLRILCLQARRKMGEQMTFQSKA
jgi:hypothetical protein